MAYINRRRLFWDPPVADATGVEVYVGSAQEPDFLARVDARLIEPTYRLPGDATEVFLDGLEDGIYQFAAVQGDAAGNWSDPLQPPTWQNVPLDTNPPPALTGGGID